MTNLVFTKTVDMATDLDWRILRSEAGANEVVQSGNKYSASYLGTFKLSNTGASGAITDLRISREGIVILESKAVDMQVDDTLRIIEGGGGQREIMEFVLRGDDVITGSAGNDRISAMGGTDRIVAGSGNDLINGGAGSDTAVYQGKKADYSVVRNADGTYLVTDKVAGRDGADTLIDVESLQFSDGVIALSANPTASGPSSTAPTISDDSLTNGPTSDSSTSTGQTSSGTATDDSPSSSSSSTGSTSSSSATDDSPSSSSSSTDSTSSSSATDDSKSSSSSSTGSTSSSSATDDSPSSSSSSSSSSSDGLSFAGLFTANLSQSKAIAAAYQTFLGGVPSKAGFDFLIKGNLATNFGAGPGKAFNDENIYINVVNSLVQGNPAAEAKFKDLAAGRTLADQITSLYENIIPQTKQTAEGLAFLIRPDGLKFYQDVAKERGIPADQGPAIVAMASILKIAVDGKIGIGNPVNDLVVSIADGSSELPATSTVLLAIESVDGSKLDADDAPDVMPGFWAASPALTAVADVAATDAGKAVTIDVLANDTDAEKDALTISSVTVPTARARPRSSMARWSMIPARPLRGLLPAPRRRWS